MTVQSTHTLYTNRAEPRFNKACKLLARNTRLRVASEHAQDRGTDQQRLRVVGTHAERARERCERRGEFVTALLQRRLQHQNVGQGRVLFHPGCEHGLCVAEVAQIAAQAGLLDIELGQGNCHIDPTLRQASCRHIGVTGSRRQLGQYHIVTTRYVLKRVCTREVDSAQQPNYEEGEKPAPLHAGPADTTTHVPSTLIGALVSSPTGVTATNPPSTANGLVVSEVLVCTMASTAAVSRSIGGGGAGADGGAVGGAPPRFPPQLASPMQTTVVLTNIAILVFMLLDLTAWRLGWRWHRRPSRGIQGVAYSSTGTPSGNWPDWPELRRCTLTAAMRRRPDPDPWRCRH